MNTQTNKRNWSDYNKKLKKQSRIDVYLSEDLIASWDYSGPRAPGGMIKYWDATIEMCLVVRELFGLALRQTQGFLQSILDTIKPGLLVPDYTTMSRRASKLKITLQKLNTSIQGQDVILAVDSTGLSVYRRDEWNRMKHGRSDGKWQEKWRKLHICIDVANGTIIQAKYTTANTADCTQIEGLLADIEPGTVKAVCADMAYDTITSRRAIKALGARQLIPPIRKARLSKANRNNKKYKDILQERDEAILYIRHNHINGDPALARSTWKKHVGYHKRSRVESVISQIKAHTRTKLTNRTEKNREAQAMIKCKLINILATI